KGGMRGFPDGLLESFEELDQGALVIVAQPRLLLEGAAAEVVPAVHDVVRALAELVESAAQFRELTARLLVGGLRRPRAQVGLDVEEQLGNLRAVLDPVSRAAAVRHELEIAEEVDGHTRWDGTNLHPALPEKPRHITVQRPEERAQERREVAAGHPEIATRGGAIDEAGN